jgi:hypothetical protein
MTRKPVADAVFPDGPEIGSASGWQVAGLNATFSVPVRADPPMDVSVGGVPTRGTPIAGSEQGEWTEAVTKKQQTQRKFYVFVSLVTVLSFTSMLLLVLSPQPLRPDAVSSLFAIDASNSMDAIYRTDVPVSPTRWKYIYIHHSDTAGGNAYTIGNATQGLGDHFVIGNGDGAADGELQIGHRWNRQEPALPPAGVTRFDPRFISICLVGDFDHGKPTPAQLRRLKQLTSSLQVKLGIPGDAIIALDHPTGPAGVGKLFSLASLQD